MKAVFSRQATRCACATRTESTRWAAVILPMNSTGRDITRIGAALAASLTLCTVATAADVILNEWNCVGSQKWLDNPDGPTAGCANPDGPDGFGCTEGYDMLFGRVLGNDDGSHSTFGSANTWVLCPSNAAVTQSFAAFPISGCEYAPANPADLDGDGTTNGADPGVPLGSWSN